MNILLFVFLAAGVWLGYKIGLQDGNTFLAKTKNYFDLNKPWK